MQRVGVGYRCALGGWIRSRPAEIECLEVTAEHFFDGGAPLLTELGAHYECYVHGLGLSLGTPGPLDGATLERFGAVADAVDAAWVSDHVAFTRAGGVDLGHLNPVRPDRATLRLLAEHVRQVAHHCGRPVLLENITSHVRVPGPMTEPAFLNALCDASGAGLLLDVTNVLVNARNHGFDAREWLAAIDPGHVVQLHVVGYSRCDGRYQDRHATAIQPDVFALADFVLDRAPVQAVIIERDADFPPVEALAAELRALKRPGRERRALHARHGAAAL